MAVGEAKEDEKSGEGRPGEDEGSGSGEKKSEDSVEGAGADAAEEKKVAGKSRRGRKPRGAPEALGKKASRKRPAAEGKPAVERPARERKTVERFSAVSSQRAAAAKGVSIQEGTGTKLKDIPNVFFKLSKRRADENLQLLHTILFAKKAKALYLKRNIYQFSGFVWTENEEKQRARVKEKLDKCVKDKLLDFCDILDIPVAKATTKKEEMSAKLLEFLESPHVTRDTLIAEKEQKGRKRKRRTKGTSEATSVEADSDIEMKRKKSNVPSTMKKRHKKSAKVAEEDEEEVGSDNGMSVDSTVNQGEGGAQESEDEKNVTEDEGDEQEPVVGKKVSTQRQKSKSPVKSAKGSSGSLSKKAPLEGKGRGRGPGKSSKGSSVEENKRGPKASTKQDETTKKGSAMSNKSTLNSRTSAQVCKNDSRPYEASKQKGGKSKSRENDSLTEDKDKKKGRQPGLSVSAKKQGKERAGGRAEPTREEVHAVVRGILKEVDFNTATLADILRQLGSEFGMDLMHRKAEVKSIIEEAINDMTDDEEDGENEGEEEAQDDVDA